MSKAVKGYHQLIKAKKQEIEDYCIKHIDILKPFLDLQKELRELSDKQHYARMNEVDLILKKKSK